MNENPDDEFDDDNPPTPGLSFYWDVLLPLIITGVPMLCFGALRVLFELAPRPQADGGPIWMGVLVLALTLIGMTSMAILVLFRLKRAMMDLDRGFQERPPLWRRWMVLASLFCLTIVDVTCNITMMVPGGGGEFLLVGAAVFYGIYLALMYVAHRGAQTDAEFGG
ncbi:MAG: hypothetical protein KDA69_04470 [Planctomycetaceae bacterium]|nr:hypothetical protein [Planctomycetaceae bacterium]